MLCMSKPIELPSIEGTLYTIFKIYILEVRVTQDRMQNAIKLTLSQICEINLTVLQVYEITLLKQVRGKGGLRNFGSKCSL